MVIFAISASASRSRSIHWGSTISSVKYSVVFLLAIIVFISCGPKPKEIPAPVPVKELPAPYGLSADAGSRQAVIKWSVDRDPSQPISGYNIYLAENISESDTSAWKKNPGAPYNHVPYPGDTDGDINHETMPLENLANGRIYFVFVTTLGIDGAQSGPSNIVGFIPVARGTFTVSDNHSAENGGFSFDVEKSVSAYNTSCDLYLYATETKVGLSSPNRLTPGMRKSYFSRGIESSLVESTIAVLSGDRIYVRTGNGSANLIVESVEKNASGVLVRIRYTYAPDSDDDK